MTNISDIKYVQAPEKRPGKRTLIAGITLVAVNIVMAILLSVASGFFNDPRFSMVTRFFNIYLYFIIGAIAIAVGIYRMVNEKGTSRTYHAEIKSNNGEYNLYVVSINEAGIVCGRRAKWITSLLVFIVATYIFGILFGILIDWIVDSLLPYKVCIRIYKSDIKNITISENTICIEEISGTQTILQSQKHFKHIVENLNYFHYNISNLSHEQTFTSPEYTSDCYSTTKKNYAPLPVNSVPVNTDTGIKKQPVFFSTLFPLIITIWALFSCFVVAYCTEGDYAPHYKFTVDNYNKDYFGSDFQGTDAFKYTYTLNGKEITDGEIIHTTSDESIQIKIKIKHSSRGSTSPNNTVTFRSSELTKTTQKTLTTTIKATSITYGEKRLWEYTNNPGTRGYSYAEICTTIKLKPIYSYNIAFIVIAAIGWIIICFLCAKNRKIKQAGSESK